MKCGLNFIVLLLLLISCKEKPQQTRDPREATDSLGLDINVQTMPEVALSSKTREAIASWEAFSRLESNVRSLDTARIETLRLQSKLYLDNVFDLVRETPDSLVNSSIKARLLEVYAKMNMLVQEASSLQVDTTAVKREGTELYTAFQNLKLQLNLKHQQSIEELLERFGMEADSLARSSDTLRPDRSKKNIKKRLE